MRPDSELLLPDAAAWRAWLEQHHDTSDGVWLVLTRKGGTVTSLTRDEALDVVLCFGWIDGQAASRDAESVFQRYTPRRARSPWSQRNVDHVARLTAAGLMAPAGQAAIDAAKADGRWDAAYAPQSDGVIAPEWADVLAANPKVAAAWEVLTKANRFAITFRITQAKRDETKRKRIAQFVEMLERGETIYPQKARLP